MVKQRSDLREIYEGLYDRHINNETQNASLARAMCNVRWEAYTQALMDFDIINENERNVLLGWMYGD